jgi:predicted phosphodiesterase
MNNDKGDKISILLVSDVHEAKGNIVKLRAILDKLTDISFILCLGDLHNLVNEDPK